MKTFLKKAKKSSVILVIGITSPGCGLNDKLLNQEHESTLSKVKITDQFGVGANRDDLIVDTFIDQQEEQFVLNLFAQNIISLHQHSRKESQGLRLAAKATIHDSGHQHHEPQSQAKHDPKKPTTEAISYAKEYLAKVRDDDIYYSQQKKDEREACRFLCIAIQIQYR